MAAQTTPVILISVDGLASWAIPLAETPTWDRMTAEGATTLNARTIVEATKTFPNHTSIFTGRAAAGPGGHRVTVNVDDGSSTVHDHAGTYIPGIFDLAHDAGLTTSFFTQKLKMDFFDRSWNEIAGAPDQTGEDNGKDKIDRYERTWLTAMVAAIRNELTSNPSDLTFIHFAETDFAGHDFGFESSEYLDAVERVDGYVGELLDTIAGQPSLADAVVVLTADHGGTGFVHAEHTDPDNFTIPFAVWGRTVDAGVDLYAINPVRSDPGFLQPPYSEEIPPIRNADAANLVTELLGLSVIPGSTINAQGDLRIASLEPGDGLPVVRLVGPVDGAVVEGSVSVTAEASDDVGVSQVEFYVGDTAVGTDTDGNDGWAIGWDSTTVPDGQHFLRATATDTAGQQDSHTISVTVSNSPISTNRVLIIVGNSANPTNGDLAVRERLVTSGYQVTFIDDNTAAPDDAQQHDLVIVSSSISSGTIDTDIADTPIPILVAKPYVFDDFGLTLSPTSNYGTSTVSTISIATHDHPTAAGLDGNITLRNPVTTISRGIAPTTAFVTATTTNGNSTIWHIPPSQTLADNTPAPACRATFPLFGDMPTTYTQRAWQLFDATITWTHQNCH